MIQGLMTDYAAAVRHLPHGSPHAAKIATVEAALLRLSRYVGSHPTTLFQELYNLFARAESDDTTTHDPAWFSSLAADWRARVTGAHRRPWIEALYPPPSLQEDRLTYTLVTRHTRGVAYSPGGEAIAIGAGEGISVCEAATGILWVTVPTPAPVIAVTFSDDGATVAALTMDGWVVLIRSDTGETVRRFEAIDTISGSQIVGQLKLQNVFKSILQQVGNSCSVRYMFPHADLTFGCIRFSPDGRRLAVCGGGSRNETSPPPHAGRSRP